MAGLGWWHRQFCDCHEGRGAAVGAAASCPRAAIRLSCEMEAGTALSATLPHLPALRSCRATSLRLPAAQSLLQSTALTSLLPGAALWVSPVPPSSAVLTAIHQPPSPPAAQQVPSRSPGRLCARSAHRRVLHCPRGSRSAPPYDAARRHGAALSGEGGPRGAPALPALKVSLSLRRRPR